MHWLSELVAAAPTRKITRMALACLHNLAKAEDSNILTEIFATNLPRLVDSMMDNEGYKVYKDAEFEADVKGLSIVLEKNFRELSTFERWATEVNSGKSALGNCTHNEILEGQSSVHGGGRFRPSSKSSSLAWTAATPRRSA